jgi:hypothetical protein
VWRVRRDMVFKYGRKKKHYSKNTMQRSYRGSRWSRGSKGRGQRQRSYRAIDISKYPDISKHVVMKQTFKIDYILDKMFAYFDKVFQPEAFYGLFTSTFQSAMPFKNFLLGSQPRVDLHAETERFFDRHKENGVLIFFEGSHEMNVDPMRNMPQKYKTFWRDFMKCTQRCLCAVVLLNMLLKDKIEIKLQNGELLKAAQVVVYQEKFFLHDHHTMMTPNSPPSSIMSCMPVYDKPTHNILKLTDSNDTLMYLELTPGQIDPTKNVRWKFTDGVPHKNHPLPDSHITNEYMYHARQIARSLSVFPEVFQIIHYPETH